MLCEFMLILIFYWFFISARRAAPPLEIEGLPGYDRLTPSEKEVSGFFVAFQKHMLVKEKEL